MSTEDSRKIVGLCRLLNYLDNNDYSLSHQEAVQYTEDSITYLDRLYQLLEAGGKISLEEDRGQRLINNASQFDGRTENTLNALSWERRQQVYTLIHQAANNSGSKESLKYKTVVNVLEKIKSDIESILNH